jgi:fatty-acyl-CoA synthase
MAVPTMLHRMAEDPYFHEANLKPTRYLITGGEYISTPLITRWVRKGVPVRQGYGLTEVGPNVTSLSQEEAELKAGSVGSPNFYLRWCVVDQAGGLIFRPEEVGELYLAGPIVTPGYWNRPDESPLVEFNGEHWFPTGDLVRMDADRNLYMVDRKSNRIVSGGENIFPSEIERVLERHAAVSEVVVVGVPDPDWGEVAMAFIVAHPHTAVDENLLRRHCERKLARFKVPKRFRFVSSLPKTDSGKLDRAHLMSTASL